MNPGNTEHIKSRPRATYWLGIVTLICLFVVNTLGFTDTITGSALGCGRNFPLCNGQLIPTHWETATVIEYVHRLSVLLGSTLLAVLTVAVAWKYRRHRRLLTLAALPFSGVVLEAVLGAISVLTPNPPVVMAAHFGIALLSFVGVFLIVVALRAERQGTHDIPTATEPQAIRRFRRAVWWSLPYAYIAMYVGAYVMYKGYGGSFAGWPIPTESFAVAGMALVVDLVHRTLALGFLCWMVTLVVLARRFKRDRKDLFRGSIVSLTLVCLQALSGALLIYTQIAVYAFLLHVTIVTLLFTSQCYLAYQSLGRSVPREVPPERRFKTPSVRMRATNS